MLLTSGDSWFQNKNIRRKKICQKQYFSTTVFREGLAYPCIQDIMILDKNTSSIQTILSATEFHRLMTLQHPFFVGGGTYPPLY